MGNFDFDLQAIQEVREAVGQAHQAQQIFQTFSQEKIDSIVAAMAQAAYAQALPLAELAVQETGLGVVEHKLIKNQVSSSDVYESIKNEKTVGIIQELPEQQMLEVAAPYGVIAAITPVTNPTSTAIFKSLIALKAGNAIVFSPHPAAKKCTGEAAHICLRAAVEAGAPEGIIRCLSKPTIGATEELMKHKDIQLILSTGGGGLVRAAYSSGKPAYGVGPGNVPAYIEKTADISRAVRHIIESKTFDNGTICASEQALVVDKNIKELVIREFKNQGSYFLNEEEKQKVAQLISPIPGRLNPQIVGKAAIQIAEWAGIKVPENTRLLIAHETAVGKEIPFSLEKLSPLFAFYTVENSEASLKLCQQLLALGGRGHTLALHTQDKKLARTFALEMPVSRIVVNTPAAIGAIGGTTALKPSMTLGCGSFGGNITSDNITVQHLFNKKRLAYGLKELQLPTKLSSSTIPIKKQSLDRQKMEEVIAEVLAQVDTQGPINKTSITKVVQEVLTTMSN